MFYTVWHVWFHFRYSFPNPSTHSRVKRKHSSGYLSMFMTSSPRTPAPLFSTCCLKASAEPRSFWKILQTANHHPFKTQKALSVCSVDSRRPPETELVLHLGHLTSLQTRLFQSRCTQVETLKSMRVSKASVSFALRLRVCSKFEDHEVCTCFSLTFQKLHISLSTKSHFYHFVFVLCLRFLTYHLDKWSYCFSWRRFTSSLSHSERFLRRLEDCSTIPKRVHCS